MTREQTDDREPTAGCFSRWVHPDWYVNLMAGPDRASIEFPGRDNLPMAPQRLDGADREQAWQRIAAAQPRLAKYQHKTDRSVR